MNATPDRPSDASLLTHSACSCFQACPRRFAYSYVQGLRPIHTSDALRTGDAFHVGLEAAMGGSDEREAEQAVRNRYAIADCPPWLARDDFEVEQETAVAMVKGWMRRYGDDGIVKAVAVELKFDLPLINPNTGRPHPYYRNAGKIDGIVELPDGKLAIIEHKSVGEDLAADGDYWKRLLLDHQISRYYLAAQELGYDVQTVVFDCVRKPLIRPKAVSKADRQQSTYHKHYHGVTLTAMCPDRETPAMYGARVLSDMGERPAWYFARMEIPRLQSDLDEYERDRWAIVSQIASCEAAGYWPRNTVSCTSPYTCRFLDVCRNMRTLGENDVPDGFKITKKLHPELAVEALETV